jgi:phage minor structural protein
VKKLLYNIDLSLLPHKPKLFLCKPNRQIISKLKNSFNTSLNLRLGSLSELTLSIPSQIEKNHLLIKNPDLDRVKDRYNIKLEYNNLTIWFVINEITDTMDSDSKQIHAFSSEHEIADKYIRAYTSKNINGDDSPVNCTKALTDALSKTTWSVGTVPSLFDLKFRSFEVSRKTALDFVYEIATTFNGILIFNTETKQVNIYQPESIGLNKGLRFSYGKLLNNVVLKRSSDEMVTRLRMYGKDNLSIASVNPIGSDYIEDFTFFKTLDHMSQELITAQNAYEALLEENKTSFSSLLSQLNIKQILLTQQQTELSDLQVTMDQILDSIDVAQTASTPLSTTDLFTQKASQQVLIDAKNVEISITMTDISSVSLVITVSTGCTNSSNIRFFIGNVLDIPITIAVMTGDTANSVANKINTAFNTHGIDVFNRATVVNNVVTLIYYTTKDEADCSVNFSGYESGVTVSIVKSNFGISNHINKLKKLLSIESNFTPTQITERNLFEIEKVLVMKVTQMHKNYMITLDQNLKKLKCHKL